MVLLSDSKATTFRNFEWSNDGQMHRSIAFRFVFLLLAPSLPARPVLPTMQPVPHFYASHPFMSNYAYQPGFGYVPPQAPGIPIQNSSVTGDGKPLERAPSLASGKRDYTLDHKKFIVRKRLEMQPLLDNKLHKNEHIWDRVESGWHMQQAKA